VAPEKSMSWGEGKAPPEGKSQKKTRPGDSERKKDPVPKRSLIRKFRMSD
jgi:hypothetical protein